MTDLAHWRIHLIEAINLLRSGAIDPYAVILDAESFGEGSSVMAACRAVLDEMAITDGDLARWEKSYMERIKRPVPSSPNFES